MDLRRNGQPALAAPNRKLGIWMIGAAGNVATTVAVGAAALRQGKDEATIGLLTESPPLSNLPLVSFDRIVLGGHEIRRQRVIDTVEQLHASSGLFSRELLEAARPVLAAYQKNIKAGTALQCGPDIERLANRAGLATADTPRAVIDRLRTDLRSFQRRHALDRVVVIHVASTEPLRKTEATCQTWKQLGQALGRRRGCPLPASSLYAIAAIEESMPFVNFTPSLAADVPAIRERAADLHVPIMGSDGKTGETLLKSVLAPLFQQRRLPVLSWVGHNILGNQDGRVLDTPTNKASKISTKNGIVGSIVGGRPEAKTTIEYVASMGDWKTAWDHIHFAGFLGTRMHVQFIWQGCDSILAAPLVLDLARLADYHAEQGRAGVMTHLASYFKSPMDVREHSLFVQIAMLHDYVQQDLAVAPQGVRV